MFTGGCFRSRCSFRGGYLGGDSAHEGVGEGVTDGVEIGHVEPGDRGQGPPGEHVHRDRSQQQLPACAELGIGFVPFSPLGKGFLTGTVSATTEFAAGDVRATIPRFAADNINANEALVSHVRGLAETKDSSPGQIALAWLLAQHPWIVPIPGTRSRARVDENAGATAVALSADEIADLDTLASRIGVQGDRYNPAGMAMVGL